MPKVLASITMSLDGFIAGVNDTPEQPLGENGEHLHDWILKGNYPSKHNDFFKLSKKNREIFDEMYDCTGALICGRRMYDIVHGWEGSYPVSGIPVSVLTHEPPTQVPEGYTTFIFVTKGIQHANKKAKAAAGNKNVQIIGGAQTIQQAINSGLCNILRIHMVPQLLGQGINLLENLSINKIRFENKTVISTEGVVHLYYNSVSVK